MRPSAFAQQSVALLPTPKGLWNKPGGPTYLKKPISNPPKSTLSVAPPGLWVGIRLSWLLWGFAQLQSKNDTKKYTHNQRGSRPNQSFWIWRVPLPPPLCAFHVHRPVRHFINTMRESARQIFAMFTSLGVAILANIAGLCQLGLHHLTFGPWAICIYE